MQAKRLNVCRRNFKRWSKQQTVRQQIL